MGLSVTVSDFVKQIQTESVTWCMAEACLQREHILLWSRDRRTLGPELGRGI